MEGFEALTGLTGLAALGIVGFLVWFAKTLASGGLNDAVIGNKVEKVRQLLAEGKDPNVLTPQWSDVGGWAPIHNVSSAEMIEVLLDAGADVNRLSAHGWSPISVHINRFSGEDGEIEVIEALIKSGAHFSETDTCGMDLARKVLNDANRIELLEQLRANAQDPTS